MVIRSLELENYRNFERLNVEFFPGVNYIHGNNGQGKTNLIESIYFITHLKSFRTSSIKDLCIFTENSSSIKASLEKRGVSHEVNINLYQNLKRVLFDRKKIDLVSEYIKNFFSLLFAPDQLASFKEYPLERRNFFDRVLLLTDPSYFQNIKDFNRIKKQKGILLRKGDSKNIFIWNQLLAAVAPKIIKSRGSLTEQINKKVSKIFFALTGRTEKLRLNYRNDFEGRSEIDENDIQSFLSRKLETELNKGHLCYGPHKDNFWMVLDERKDRQTFSQGEYRIAFLALQLAINHTIFEYLKFNPVLLLDDVFSELDEEVCGKTIDYISQNENQVFITSTTIPKGFKKIGRSFDIYSGGIVLSK